MGHALLPFLLLALCAAVTLAAPDQQDIQIRLQQGDGDGLTIVSDNGDVTVGGEELKAIPASSDITLQLQPEGLSAGGGAAAPEAKKLAIALESAKEGAEAELNLAQAGLRDAADSLIASMTSLRDVTEQSLGQTLDEVGDAISDVVDKMGDVAQQVGEGIQQAGEHVGDALETAANSVGDFLGDLLKGRRRKLLRQ